MKKTMLFVIAITGLFINTAFAGNEMGNGGTDQLPWSYGSAWFVGSQNKIQFCTVFDEKFGVSKDFAEKSIVEAFSVWKKYLDDKLHWDHHLTTSLQQLSVCDGTEDLKFYFGPNNDEVLKYKGKYLSPIAFSTRTQFDEDKGWSKGFIWIGSSSETNVNWNIPNNLTGTILHEVGHILGCSHVDGTIMREDHGNLIKYPDVNPESKFLGQIDGSKDLFLCSHCKFNYAGVLAYGYGKGYNRAPTTQVELENIFKVFMNRLPKGKPRGRISGTENTKDQYRYLFELSDDSGSISIPITFQSNHDWAQRNFDTIFGREGDVFKIISKGYSSVFSSMGQWAYGTAMLAEGKTIPILLERNMAGFLSLKYIVDGNVHNLIRAER